jgi:hypothetical protein
LQIHVHDSDRPRRSLRVASAKLHRLSGPLSPCVKWHTKQKYSACAACSACSACSVVLTGRYSMAKGCFCHSASSFAGRSGCDIRRDRIADPRMTGSWSHTRTYKSDKWFLEFPLVTAFTSWRAICLLHYPFGHFGPSPPSTFVPSIARPSMLAHKAERQALSEQGFFSFQRIVVRVLRQLTPLAHANPRRQRPNSTGRGQTRTPFLGRMPAVTRFPGIWHEKLRLFMTSTTFPTSRLCSFSQTVPWWRFLYPDFDG